VIMVSGIIINKTMNMMITTPITTTMTVTTTTLSPIPTAV